MHFLYDYIIYVKFLQSRGGLNNTDMVLPFHEMQFSFIVTR